jgi:TolB-like protein
MTDLWQRLKERKLVQWALAYVAAAFAFLQGIDIVAQRFGWPDAVERILIVAICVGFFVALLLAWYHGEQGRQRASGTELLLIALVLAVGGGFLWKVAVNTSQPSVPIAAVTALASNAAPPTAGESNSIAVLPFVNMSSDKEQDYFSDGLSEELLNQLAQIPQLRVIARTSSFSFKGKEVDVADIAKILNVANVLEGSVRKSGDTLRITAQLIRTSDSSHLWSQTYDRKLTDIFKVQDEISTEVVNALKLKLLPNQALGTTQRTTNVEAYNQFLLGMKDSPGGSKTRSQRSIAVFERAIALDPNYANVYAALARRKLSLADYADSPVQREDMIRQVFTLADKAIALAPDLSVGYAVRAELRYRAGSDWQGAEADFRHALALDPNNVYALSGFAQQQFFSGHPVEAIAMDRRAVVIDPLSIDAWMNMGMHLAFSGQSAEARTALKKALEIAPGRNWPTILLGHLDLKEGKFDDAFAQFQGADDESFRLLGTSMAQFSRGRDRESLQALEELKSKYEVGFAYQIAEAYSWRGDKEQALRWLERAHELNDAGLFRMRYDPMLAAVRDEPRFKAVAKKVGIPK